MRIVYDLLIHFYSYLICFAAFFNTKAKQRVQGIKMQKERILAFDKGKRECIWMHCASLGEFEQGRPLLQKIKNEKPETSIVITFFSPSGYEKCKNYAVADEVFYLYDDTKKNAAFFVNNINPDKVFFVKYEFWYRHIQAIYKTEAKLFLIAGIFRQNQVFFKFYGRFFKNILRNFTHFYLQNQNSSNLLASIELTNTTVCGDPRFDRVASVASQKKEINGISEFKTESTVLIAGSTWKPDETLIADFLKKKKCKENLKIIIAPHEISEDRIRFIENIMPGNIIRYSARTKEKLINAKILIIDNIGMLSHLYRYADICYIGGGFGAGIHNSLEAAVFGKPIFFGPKYSKFSEAVALIEKNAAFSITSQSEFYTELEHMLQSNDARRKASENAASYCKSMTGSTNRIFTDVFF